MHAGRDCANGTILPRAACQEWNSDSVGYGVPSSHPTCKYSLDGSLGPDWLGLYPIKKMYQYYATVMPWQGYEPCREPRWPNITCSNATGVARVVAADMRGTPQSGSGWFGFYLRDLTVATGLDELRSLSLELLSSPNFHAFPEWLSRCVCPMCPMCKHTWKRAVGAGGKAASCVVNWSRP